jgi:hypothetical protein
MKVSGRRRYGGVWGFRFGDTGQPVVAVTIADGAGAMTLRMNPHHAVAFAEAISAEAIELTVEGTD